MREISLDGQVVTNIVSREPMSSFCDSQNREKPACSTISIILTTPTILEAVMATNVGEINASIFREQL